MSKQLNVMELVIDANILMSALIAAGGKTFDLMYMERIRLYSVDKLSHEVEKYKEEILAKSGLSQDEFEFILSLLSTRIEFIPYAEITPFVPEAEKITPDPNDTEYFALALKLKCGLWSNDKRLKQQSRVKVYSTEDLVKET